jgi:dTDP-4-dehydrorhamnose reductase
MSKPQRSVVLVGAGGQLGKTLQALWPSSNLNSSTRLIALTREQLDISDAHAVTTVMNELCPALLINAAAYTAVDAAETDADTAFAINATGAGNLACWAAGQAADTTRLIHVSTDFVFDGSASEPYAEDAACAPLGVYGASKLAGEREMIEAMPSACVLRTSWLYSEHGGNFVKTMLRLMAERDELSIVNDQIGAPTSTRSLGAVILAMAEALLGSSHSLPAGVFQWSDGGDISWYDFAEEIQRQAVNSGLLSRAITLRPIPSSAYPTPARRPAYSVMSRQRVQEALACPQTSWQAELADVIAVLSKKAGI